jgi:uncharacterized protein (TIGR03032 family)
MNNSSIPLSPFSCTYSSHVPEILFKLNCSIAVTTYQAGKLVFISAKDEDSIIQLPRTFDKPMGIAVDPIKDKLALACKEEVMVFANSRGLADHYPNAPQKYDALYMPRVTYHTGTLDIHDLYFGEGNQLFAVNTLFSCIIKLDDDFNFTPYWKPWFVDRIVSEDRCHLNGLAMLNGKPKYATAFNTGNSFQSWRENVTSTGVIIDIETNELILEGLGMPHSPRIYNGELYCLLSATGELIRVNTAEKTYEVVVKIPGFVRGMDLHKDYLFVGLSKLRKNSSTFAKLDFADAANEAGIVIIHLPTGSIAGKITYQTSLDEIYDIHILADKKRPNILNTLTPDYKKGLMTPDSTYWAKPE